MLVAVAALIVTTVGGVCGCSGSGEPHGAITAPASKVGQHGDPATTAAGIVGGLTDELLVGQVLMPYAYGNDARDVSAASQAANRRYSGVSTPAELVAKYRPAGLILVSSSADDPTASTNVTTNVESPTQVRRLTSGLQSAATAAGTAPLLVATDQEYGVVTRIKDGVVQVPAALALGAGHDPASTERAWRAAGVDLATMGINVDFAPDADVLGGRPGGVIGSRSFGSDPGAVGDQVAAAVRGLAGSSVAATLKHFPGHGQTITDSHTDLPLLAQSLPSLNAVDLVPFVAGVKAGAELVMSGHLNVTAIDPGVPASFSSKVLIDLLRGQLGFTGVVVTDSLNMAPAKRWSVGDAAVRAVMAGNDLLLMPPNLGAAQQGLLEGLRSGALRRSRLVEAATRVLTLRLKVAERKQPGIAEVNSAAGKKAAATAAAEAITVFRGACHAALVSGAVRVTAAAGEKQAGWLRTALRSRGFTVVPTGGTQIRLVGYADNEDDLVDDAAITVATDTPYVLGSANSPTLIATYSSTQVAMTALAAVLAGKATAPGRSPVAVDGLPRSACTD